MTHPGKQFGDTTGGYSVSTDLDPAEVQVKAWGFWNVDVATSFRTTVLEACASPLCKRLVLDMRALKPMRDEGQQGVSALMAALPRLGIEHTTVVTSSQLTRLQLLRIVRESAVKDRVDFVQRAEDG